MSRALLAVLAALLAAPASALANPNQESMFQDDNQLIYLPEEQLRTNLDTLRSLGVDRLRVTLLWKVVAPAAGSRERPPGFDASDPEAYPPGAWERYDVLVREARERGLRVNFNLTGPAPLWATRPAPRDDILDTFEPSATEFGMFVTAAGRRYSGSWAGGSIPRVAYWSIWNEPNHSGWLTPQWSADSRTSFARAASLYRELFDAAYAALQATGHGHDVILVGETAPKGDRSRGIKRYLEAMTFVRALYCVDGGYRPLRGPRAGELGCASDRAAFRAAHPGLFSASGYAHHPYELILPPTFRPPRANWVTIGNLSRLTRALDRIFRSYGSRRRMPLYLTEYGYQTNPPDPAGVKHSLQAAYLNQSEYIAWRNPRVKTLSQFLLVDDDPAIPASFQSGLVTREGVRKRSFFAYRLPIWLPNPRVRRGRSFRVWGLVRAAEPGRPATVAVEYRRAGSRKWHRLRVVTTSQRRHYLQTRVRVRRSGHIRLRHGDTVSRIAFIRIR